MKSVKSLLCIVPIMLLLIFCCYSNKCTERTVTLYEAVASELSSSSYDVFDRSVENHRLPILNFTTEMEVIDNITVMVYDTTVNPEYSSEESKQIFDNVKTILEEYADLANYTYSKTTYNLISGILEVGNGTDFTDDEYAVLKINVDNLLNTFTTSIFIKFIVFFVLTVVSIISLYLLWELRNE